VDPDALPEPRRQEALDGKQKEVTDKDWPLALSEDDHGSDKFYVPGSSDARDPKCFAGTEAAPRACS
jgi:hypothetical protein